MKYKTIYHLGGWNRNLGDEVIKTSIKENFQRLYDTPLNFIYIDYQNTKITYELIETMNRNGDMILVGGGGAVMHREEDKSVSGWQFNIEKNNLYKIKIPLVVYGIGFNQFYYDDRGFKKGTFEHLVETQKVSSLFSVRNRGSRNELVGYGLDIDKIDIIPDSGSFLKPIDVKIPGLKNNRFLLGINWVMDRIKYSFQEPYFENRWKLVATIAKTFLNLIKECNVQIVQIEHITNLDIQITRYLEEMLGKKNFISIEKQSSFLERKLPIIFPLNEIASRSLIDIYRQMDLVIGMRAHSNIISWGVGTPFIAMASNNKNKYFLEEINEKEYLIDITKDYHINEDFIINKINMLINDSTYKKRNEKKFETAKNIFNEYNTKVLNLL